MTDWMMTYCDVMLTPTQEECVCQCRRQCQCHHTQMLTLTYYVLTQCCWQLMTTAVTVTMCNSRQHHTQLTSDSQWLTSLCRWLTSSHTTDIRQSMTHVTMSMTHVITHNWHQTVNDSRHCVNDSRHHTQLTSDSQWLTSLWFRFSKV